MYQLKKVLNQGLNCTKKSKFEEINMNLEGFFNLLKNIKTLLINYLILNSQNLMRSKQPLQQKFYQYLNFDLF